MCAASMATAKAIIPDATAIRLPMPATSSEAYVMTPKNSPKSAEMKVMRY